MIQSDEIKIRMQRVIKAECDRCDWIGIGAGKREIFALVTRHTDLQHPEMPVNIVWGKNETSSPN